VAFVLALRGFSITKLMLYLCDNQVLLNAVGEGGKVMLVGELDADILQEAIEVFREKKQQEQRRF